MIPLRDINPTYRRPIVTIGLLVANALVFLYQLSLSEDGLARLVFTLGMVPARLTLFPASPEVGASDALLPLFTSMFLHGGFLHVLSNLWFLWVFGDNIEDRLGHWRFLVFYLVSGLLAGLAHAVMNLHSTVPAIGASGAVSGVMGAYLVLFPASRVDTLVVLGIFWFRTNLPAYLMILYWFAVQLLSGTVTLAVRAGEQGGVAWWAHVGGFLAGVVLVRLFSRRPRRRAVSYGP